MTRLLKNISLKRFFTTISLVFLVILVVNFLVKKWIDQKIENADKTIIVFFDSYPKLANIISDLKQLTNDKQNRIALEENIIAEIKALDSDIQKLFDAETLLTEQNSIEKKADARFLMAWQNLTKLSETALKVPTLKDTIYFKKKIVSVYVVTNGKRRSKNEIDFWLAKEKTPNRKLHELIKRADQNYKIILRSAQQIIVMAHEHKAFYQRASSIVQLVFMGLVLLLILLVYWVIRYKILTPLEAIKQKAIDIGKDKLETETVFTLTDEISTIGQLLNKATEKLTKDTNFVNEISNGNFDIELETEGIDKESKGLTMSLLKMQQGLRDMANKDKHRRWSTEGLAKFSDLLRSGSESLDEYTYKIVTALVEYTQAAVGVLYLIDEQANNPKEAKLKSIAAYAYDRKKYIDEAFYPGETLVGQCFLEKETTFMTDLPDDYLSIRSGLGGDKPKSIVLVPLKVNNNIEGVLELASFNIIEGYQIEFLEKVSENIASEIVTAKINRQTNQLLAEAQEMTEQMRAQEEEMRQNMEELQATQEGMERQSIEMQAQIEAINNTNGLVEFDAEGKIINANKIFLDSLGYTLAELKGKSAGTLLTRKAQEEKAFEKSWEKIITKELITAEVPRLNKKGQEVWFRNSYAVIQNHAEQPLKVITLTTDITAEKQNRNLLEMAEFASSANKQNEEKCEKLVAENQTLLHKINALEQEQAQVQIAKENVEKAIGAIDKESEEKNKLLQQLTTLEKALETAKAKEADTTTKGEIEQLTTALNQATKELNRIKRENQTLKQDLDVTANTIDQNEEVKMLLENNQMQKDHYEQKIKELEKEITALLNSKP